MQQFYPGFTGSRGFFFPYPLAKTNSPSNLKITWSGKWKTYRNIQADTTCPIGLSGITASLADSVAFLHIAAYFDTLHRYDFNKVIVFCNAGETACYPEILPSRLVRETIIDGQNGFILFNLQQYADSLTLRFRMKDSASTPLQLYGISLENDDPGVTYNAVGVNGAKLSSYLRCTLLPSQLNSLDPDWVIISIGTNDGNTRHFDADVFRSEYVRLIHIIQQTTPGAAIMLTVPNDSYLLKRYINHNTAKMRDIIFSIAHENGLSVWDFYSVMGGLNSAAAWYDHGLMNKDHIHFNNAGYLLEGDLFFNAFLKSWESNLSLESQLTNESGK
jgi:lysophospholipase L1-like esterase